MLWHPKNLKFLKIMGLLTAWQTYKQYKSHCSNNFLFKQNNFFSWKTSFCSLLWASSGLRENVLLAIQEGQNCMGKVYIYNFMVDWNMVLADVMPICDNICQLWYAICHVSDTVHIVVRLMLLPLIIWQMLSPYLSYIAYRADVKPNINICITKADGIALGDCVGRCYCHVAMYIATTDM